MKFKLVFKLSIRIDSTSVMPLGNIKYRLPDSLVYDNMFLISDKII
ncbi:hypothetical protein [Brachyspira hampsonii]|nr:hypothetical protein [Brachyspira hampsonii]